MLGQPSPGSIKRLWPRAVARVSGALGESFYGIGDPGKREQQPHACATPRSTSTGAHKGCISASVLFSKRGTERSAKAGLGTPGTTKRKHAAMIHTLAS